MIFCRLLVFFMHLSSRYLKKLFVNGKNMCILAIATYFQYFFGFSKLYEQFYAQKMLKMTFFCLKSDINEKLSEEFFCFLFFLVVHIFLKTNDIVRKNGYLDSLWGGIQRCVRQSLSLFISFSVVSNSFLGLPIAFFSAFVFVSLPPFSPFFQLFLRPIFTPRPSTPPFFSTLTTDVLRPLRPTPSARLHYNCVS